MSKKSNLDEDGYNVENSNQIDNHLGGDSTIGQDYKDLFSSRVVEINNELIKLKCENEKVVKMKSEYQKLTIKLKLEIEESNSRNPPQIGVSSLKEVIFSSSSARIEFITREKIKFSRPTNTFHVN